MPRHPPCPPQPPQGEPSSCISQASPAVASDAVFTPSSSVWRSHEDFFLSRGFLGRLLYRHCPCCERKQSCLRRAVSKRPPWLLESLGKAWQEQLCGRECSWLLRSEGRPCSPLGSHLGQPTYALVLLGVSTCRSLSSPFTARGRLQVASPNPLLKPPWFRPPQEKAC